MKHMALATVLAVVISIGFGCDSKQEAAGPTTARSSGGKPRVALVMKSLANEFFKTMQDGAEAQHAAHKDEYELISDGIKNETDVDQQIALIEQMVAQHVDAIVVAPADSKALVPACKKAMDAGIIVVNIDNKLDADALRDKAINVPFVGPNNMKGAKLAGDYLAKKLTRGDAVAIIDGRPGAFNAVQRHAGFEAAMSEAGMKVVTSQAADWETDAATKLASAILTSHPETKALLCANDSMALARTRPSRTRGRSGACKLLALTISRQCRI